jgi:hypothetical protein
MRCCYNARKNKERMFAIILGRHMADYGAKLCDKNSYLQGLKMLEDVIRFYTEV